jgi:hypothetical protein
MTRFSTKDHLPTSCFPVLALAGGLLLSACASQRPYDHGLGPERLAQIQGICANTMELSPGNVHFEDCMDVLSDTARQVDQAKARQ